LDAGSDIGIGHYKRCAALANYLDGASNIKSTFLTRSDSVVSLNRPHDWETIKLAEGLSTEHELRQLAEIINSRDARVAFVDINNKNTTQNCYFSYMEQIKALGVFLASFDDFRICPPASDLVVVPYAGAENMQIDDQFGEKYLLGPKYFVLGDNFLKQSTPLQDRPARSIMVCLGGADVNNLTETIVASIIAATDDIHLNIVKGPCAAEWSSDFTRQLVESQTSHSIFDAPDDLVPIMKRSTIGVFSSGLTPYEASAVGLPSVVVSLNEYHQEVTDRLAETNSIISFGTFDKAGTNAFRQTIADLINDEERIDAMSSCGRKTVDGQGMERIMCAIVNRIG
jgi:spore coat polysaccharide biosynthesis predicted glycosyltransferase SpsG